MLILTIEKLFRQGRRVTIIDIGNLVL